MTPPFIFKPDNIWSEHRPLAVLTNPTEIAFNKGNLKFHYPIIWHNETWPDVETAYQKNKPRLMSNRMSLLEELITIKLATYPQIKESITASGGVKFLEQCCHFLRPVPDMRLHYEKRSMWEGKGRDSPFIICLIEAFISSK